MMQNPLVCLTENVLIKLEEDVPNHSSHNVTNTLDLLNRLKEFKAQEDVKLLARKKQLADNLQNFTNLSLALETEKWLQLNQQRELQERLIQQIKENMRRIYKEGNAIKQRIEGTISDIQEKDSQIDTMREGVAAYLALLQAQYTERNFDALMEHFKHQAQESVKFEGEFSYKIAKSELEAQLAAFSKKPRTMAEYAVKVLVERDPEQLRQRDRWRAFTQEYEEFHKVITQQLATTKSQVEKINTFVGQCRGLRTHLTRCTQIIRQAQDTEDHSHKLRRDLDSLQDNVGKWTQVQQSQIVPAPSSIPYGVSYGVFFASVGPKTVEARIWAFKEEQGCRYLMESTGRVNYGIALMPNIIFIVGGSRPGTGSLNSVEALSWGKRNESCLRAAKANMNSARECLSICEQGPNLFWALCGRHEAGADAKTNTVLNVCETYDVSMNAWRRRLPLNEGRYNAAACLIEFSWMYIFGGIKANNAFGAVEKLNLFEDNAKWQVVSVLQHDGINRERFTCCSLSTKKIFLVGGMASDGSTYAIYDVIMETVLKKEVKSLVTSLPTVFNQAKLSMIDGQVHLIDQEGTWHMYTPGTDLWKARPFSEWERACIKKEP